MVGLWSATFFSRATDAHLPFLPPPSCFIHRPGSLGALSLILSESGGNITEVAAHNTGDGFAVDMFSIANLERINDEMLLPHLDQRIKQALGDSNPSPRNTSVCGAYPPPASSLPPAALSSGLPGANITTNPNFTSLNPGAAGSNGSMTGAFPGATAFAMPAGGATGKIPLAAGMPVSGGVAAANAAAGMATVAAVDLGNPIGVRRTNSSCSQGSSSDVASAIASIAAAPGAAAPSPAAAAAAKVAGSEAEGSSAPLSPLAALPPLSDLVLVEEVGEGSGSKVWRGSWGNIRVAVKVLKVNPTTRKEALRGFVQEATILSQLRHPAICTLLGTCVQHGLPALVLEFMSGGSLFDLLHNSQATLTPPLLSRLALEVASGVNYLHEHSVIHRDIKSANVLLDDRMHAKVSDFGISTTFGPEHTAETGTYRCMAPEVITHQRCAALSTRSLSPNYRSIFLSDPTLLSPQVRPPLRRLLLRRPPLGDDPPPDPLWQGLGPTGRLCRRGGEAAAVYKAPAVTRGVWHLDHARVVARAKHAAVDAVDCRGDYGDRREGEGRLRCGAPLAAAARHHPAAAGRPSERGHHRRGAAAHSGVVRSAVGGDGAAYRYSAPAERGFDYRTTAHGGRAGWDGRRRLVQCSGHRAAGAHAEQRARSPPIKMVL